MVARALILVVGDEEPIRQLASLYLEKEGFQVACAADGPEAIEMAQRQRLAVPRGTGEDERSAGCADTARFTFFQNFPPPRGAENLPAGGLVGTAPED